MVENGFPMVGYMPRSPILARSLKQIQAEYKESTNLDEMGKFM